MKCSDLMRTDVECCDADESIPFVAERMRMRNVGFVPVCDAVGAVVGTITARDLVVRVLADQLDGDLMRARDVMTPSVVACKPNDEVEVAERLMARHRESRIVCVDNHKRPVGVLSLSDVVRYRGAA
jgi:CBS domain-containing protein